MKQRLSQLKERHEASVRVVESERDLRLIVSRLEDFAEKVSEGLDQLDRAGRPDIVRALVKRIDIERGEIEIVFRVPPPNAGGSSPVGKPLSNRQHCTAVHRPTLGMAVA